MYTFSMKQNEASYINKGNMQEAITESSSEYAMLESATDLSSNPVSDSALAMLS